jgi:hypothetical protein
MPNMAINQEAHPKRNERIHRSFVVKGPSSAFMRPKNPKLELVIRSRKEIGINHPEKGG